MPTLRSGSARDPPCLTPTHLKEASAKDAHSRPTCSLSSSRFVFRTSILPIVLFSRFCPLFCRLISLSLTIEYADDTLLVARTAQALNRLLHLLQYLALSRGLQLSPEKCQLLAINPLGPVSLIDEPHFPCRCPNCQRIIGEILPHLQQN